MNPRLNVTQKTYYALGVLASVLNLAGGALYLAGIYAALLFNIASFLAGAMMLMTGACAGVKSLTGRLSLLAAALVVFSLMGGVLAMLIMILLHRLPGLSIYGVSVAGAAGHNTGQVAAAVLTLGSTAPVAYLPVLLVVSVFTGALTGFVAAVLFSAMEKAKIAPGS